MTTVLDKCVCVFVLLTDQTLIARPPEFFKLRCTGLTLINKWRSHSPLHAASFLYFQLNLDILYTYCIPAIQSELVVVMLCHSSNREGQSWHLCCSWMSVCQIPGHLQFCESPTPFLSSLSALLHQRLCHLSHFWVSPSVLSLPQHFHPLFQSHLHFWILT